MIRIDQPEYLIHLITSEGPMLFEMPEPPIAFTRSSTARVEIPCT